MPGKPYHISCHCQSHVLRYTPPAGESGDFPDNGVCDCSHCLKRRTVWILAPKGSIKVVKGVKGLQEYRFGSKQSGHQFCGTCGTHLLGSEFDENADIMFNARAIREPGFELWDHPLKLYSGLDRPPKYTETTLSDLPGAEAYLEGRRSSHPDKEMKVHVGSCHCKAIQFAVLAEPLDEVRMTDCGCSICLGNGVLWMYPSRRDTYFHPSASHSEPYRPPDNLLIEYTFSDNNPRNLHYMCKNCGCQIYEYRAKADRDPDPARVKEGEDGKWEKEDGANGSLGLNVALLSDALEYLGDVQGLEEGQDGYRGKKLGGLGKKDGKYGIPYELKL